VHSGTPKPFNFGNADTIKLGSCVSVDHAYVGKSAINTTGLATERPLVSLVAGVDTLTRALNMNLTRYGLPSASLGQLFGFRIGSVRHRRLAQSEGVATLSEFPPAKTSPALASSGEDQEDDAAAGAAEAEEANQDDIAAKLALLPYLHPIKVLSGVAPPLPGSRVPMSICRSDNITWTEQFGGAGLASCPGSFHALSTLTFTPNGTALGAQKALKLNASMPVVLTNCEMKPTIKVLAVRSSAVKANVWSVTAKAAQPTITAARPADAAVAKYTVTYNRTQGLANYTLEPAVLLTNPFAKAMPVSSVYVRAQSPGYKDMVVRLTCKGANGLTGSLVLPTAAPATGPVPIGCIGKLRLPGALAGTLTITTVTPTGNVTSTPTPFDVTKGVDDVGPGSDIGKCVAIDGKFDSGSAGGDDVAAVQPTKTFGAPVPKTVLCEPKRYTFDASFGPFNNKPNNGCGSYLVRLLLLLRLLGGRGNGQRSGRRESLENVNKSKNPPFPKTKTNQTKPYQ